MIISVISFALICEWLDLWHDFHITTQLKQTELTKEQFKNYRLTVDRPGNLTIVVLENPWILNDVNHVQFTFMLIGEISASMLT